MRAPRLLSRTTPGTDELSLSHGCVVLLDGKVEHTLLRAAVSKAMLRHPMLRVFPRQDGEGRLVWAEHRGKRLEELSDRIVTTLEVSRHHQKLLSLT